MQKFNEKGVGIIMKQLDAKDINLFKRYLVLDRNVFFTYLWLLTYAFFSSSTPDSFGIPEAIMAFSLLGLSGAWGYFIVTLKALLFKNLFNKYIYLMYLVFIYLFVVPLIVGIIRGNEITNIIRDIIPFFYIFIIIFIYPILRKNREKYLKLFLILLCIIGISYSIRHLGSIDNFKNIGKTIFFGDINYFVMDPAVIFASTFLLNYGYIGLFLEKEKKRKSIRFLLLLAGLLVFSSMLATIVRGQIGLVLFSLILSTFYIFLKRPFTIFIFIVPVIFLFVVMFQEQIINIWTLIAEKTSRTEVLNGRDIETSAVFQMISYSPDYLLFGKGWGGLVTSSVAGTVRFTHNALTYFLFKSGLLGALQFILFMIILFRYFSLTTLFMNNFTLPLLLAVFNTLFVNIFLEAGYKMLTFGIVIVILILAGEIIHESKKTRC